MRHFANSPTTFDPSNKAHLNAYETYVKTGKHDPDIRFILEFPEVSIPHMLHRKVAEYHLTYAKEKEVEISNLNEVKTVAMKILTNLKRNKTAKLTLDTVELLLESVILGKKS